MALQRDMNFTMVRNWIGMHREEFFAAADRYGLMVWNEFWDGFGDPPDHSTYLARATTRCCATAPPEPGGLVRLQRGQPSDRH